METHQGGGTDAILECGGTTTHHHADGKEHRSWYGRERGPVWARALEGVKRALDPAWILNPDVLIPADRSFLDAEA